MAEYNIPVLQPNSFVDEARKFSELRQQQGQNRLLDMRMAQAPDELAMQRQQQQTDLQGKQLQNQAGQMTYDLHKHVAMKGLATDAMSKLQQAGITDPTQAQEFMNKYQDAMKPYITGVLGLPAQGYMPLDQIKALADSTPGEQAAAARQAKILDQQALMPGQLQMEQAKYGLRSEHDAAREDRNFQHQKELAGMRDAAAMERVTQRTANEYNKPLLPTMVKMIAENKEGIGTLSQSIADLDNVISSIENKKLDLGIVNNALAGAKNYLGKEDEQSTNYAQFDTFIEKLRNNVMLMAKGTQTEGDAQRALATIIKNRNSNGVVAEQLKTLKKAFENDVNIKAMNIDDINQNYGRNPEDVSKYQQMQPTIGGSKVINGAEYVMINGKVYQK